LRLDRSFHESLANLLGELFLGAAPGKLPAPPTAH
jgi:hypothetical protein